MNNNLKTINQTGELGLDGQQKISSLSKFSHELKTPLHGIMGLAKFLKKNWPNVADEKKLECISSIIDAGQTMNIILDLMMKNAENKENILFDFKEINLVPFFQKVTNHFANLHLNQKNLQIEYVVKSEKIIVVGDEFWLSQVLTNILSNAYIYAQEGVVKVILESPNDNHCHITIEDQGPGIADQFLKTIFEPFNRGEGGSKHSSGLGLSICREIIEAHGGHISAQNNSQKGTSIQIKLPVA